MAWYDDHPDAQNANPAAPTPIGTPLGGAAPTLPGSVAGNWWDISPEAQNATPAINKEPFGPPAPMAPYGPVDAAVHGFTFGADEPIRGAGAAAIDYLQGKTQGFNYPEAVAQVGRGREAYAAEHPGANLGYNLAGTLANPLTRLGGAVISEAAPAMRPWLSGTIGGATAGTQGALENTTSLENMARGSAIGTVLGAGTGYAIPAVGGALFPPLKPGVGTLRNVDVVPMPGQAVGGPLGAAESFFSHIPFVGAPVKAAREDVRGQVAAAIANEKGGPEFVRGAISKPLDVIGETLNPNALTGHAMIDDMKTKLSNAYEKAIPAVGGPFDADANTAINDALANAKLNLDGPELEKFNKFVQDRIRGKVDASSGSLSGPDFQAIDRQLGDNAHRFLGPKGTASEEPLGHAYLDLQDKMRSWLERVSPPDVAQDLQKANLAWRTAKPVELAAARTNDPEGNFTTAQLRSGARTASSTSQFARGGALMQDYANNADLGARDLTKAGTEVLGKPPGLAADVAGYTVPVAGGITAALLHPEGLGLFNPLNHPYLSAIAPALFGGAKLYSSEPVRKFTTGLLGAAGTVPPAIAPYGPAAGQVAPGLLTGLPNRQTQP